eukprot:COSAG02_NODE_538_length_20609_cov_7.009703_29_plen_75_part_00
MDHHKSQSSGGVEHVSFRRKAKAKGHVLERHVLASRTFLLQLGTGSRRAGRWIAEPEARGGIPSEKSGLARRSD